MRQAFDEFRTEKPGAAFDEFLRARGYLMGHFAIKQAEAEGRAPVAGKAEAQGTIGRAVRRVRTGMQR